jgi:hypothetical protein
MGSGAAVVALGSRHLPPVVSSRQNFDALVRRLDDCLFQALDDNALAGVVIVELQIWFGGGPKCVKIPELLVVQLRKAASDGEVGTVLLLQQREEAVEGPRNNACLRTVLLAALRLELPPKCAHIVQRRCQITLHSVCLAGARRAVNEARYVVALQHILEQREHQIIVDQGLVGVGTIDLPGRLGCISRM